MTVKQTVDAFLRDWYDWVITGAVELTGDPAFLRGHGLCHNMRMWFGGQSEALDNELSDRFAAGGYCRVYPFGVEAYDSAMHHDTMHLCEYRLAWVRCQLGIEA